MANDEAPVEVDEAASRDHDIDRGRLGILLVVLAVLVVSFLVLAKLTHRPQLVYPEGAKRVTLTVQASGERPVNEVLIKYYERLYELDPCREGKKYATVCQDGEVIWRVEEGVCSDHGGVKDWVVCR